MRFLDLAIIFKVTVEQNRSTLNVCDRLASVFPETSSKLRLTGLDWFIVYKDVVGMRYLKLARSLFILS